MLVVVYRRGRGVRRGLPQQHHASHLRALGDLYGEYVSVIPAADTRRERQEDVLPLVVHSNPERHDRCSPVQPECGRVRGHHREVKREHVHVRALLRPD